MPSLLLLVFYIVFFIVLLFSPNKCFAQMRQSNAYNPTKNKEQNDILTQQNDEVKILLPRN
jgi:hypothetical protein